MATETCELAPVTNGTGGAVLDDFAGGVAVQKVWCVVCGFETRGSRMTGFAAERHFDFVVTDEAISHLGMGGRRENLRFFQPAVASLA